MNGHSAEYEGVVLWQSGERHVTEPCDDKGVALMLARDDARGSGPVRAIWARRCRFAKRAATT